MNFKKYHVSKNLWNEDYTNISSSMKYVPLYVGDGDFTLSTTMPAHTAGTATQYTNLFLLSGNASSGASTNANGAWLDHPHTVSASGGYVTLVFRRETNSPADFKTMLNTGSSPIPYEPYGNTWHDTPHYIHNTSTDTITTLPAVLYPNDTTATVGLKGNMSQASGVSPDNPIQPSECGERTGNLFDVNRLSSDTWTIDEKYYIDGAVGDNKSDTRPNTVDVNISNGNNLTVTASSYYGAGFVIAVNPNTTYTLSFATDTVVPNSKSIATITYVDADENLLNYITVYGGTTQVTFTTPNAAHYILIVFRYASNTITYSNIMLNLGSTALPYEPYGYKIPILSNSTTTNVYLGEVESTRRIKKLVLTGEENWSRHTDTGTLVLAISGSDAAYLISGEVTCVCTHYPAQNNTSSYSQMGDKKICMRANSSNVWIRDTDYSTTTDFKTYLQQQYAAGTPVCVWYVLATETTGIVNEPLRKIGDYADTVSGISIPVTAGGDTLSVDTTLQPSEVTATYKGWHPVADVHEFTGNYTVGTMQTLPISELETHTISELQGGEWS